MVESTNGVTDPQTALLRLLLAQRARQSSTSSATRSRILSAAIPLFAGRGYAGTSMRDIARAVGIKAASIYEHFPSKEQLLYEALIEVLGQFHDYVLEVLDADQSVDEQLRHIVERHAVWQINFAEIAGAWDVLFDAQRISRVLSDDAYEDVRGRRALYHDLVHALVVARRPGEPEARLRADAVLVLCDRIHTWGEAHLKDDDAVTAFAWSLALAVIDAPLASAPGRP